MFNRILLFVILGIAILSLVGCAAEEEPKKAEQPAAAKAEAKPAEETVPVYEITKDEITSHPGWTSRNISVMNQSTGNFDTPPHSSGEILDWLVSPFAQFHSVKQLVQQPLPALTRNTVKLGVDEDVLFNAQLEITRHRLWNDTNETPNVIRLLHDVEIPDFRRAGSRQDQSREPCEYSSVSFFSSF